MSLFWIIILSIYGYWTLCKIVFAIICDEEAYVICLAPILGDFMLFISIVEEQLYEKIIISIIWPLYPLKLLCGCKIYWHNWKEVRHKEIESVCNKCGKLKMKKQEKQEKQKVDIVQEAIDRYDKIQKAKKDLYKELSK